VRKKKREYSAADN